MLTHLHAQLADTGLRTAWHLYRELIEAGQQPAIVESRGLLPVPGGVLEKLCTHLEIPFMDEMLSWQSGPRPANGVWGPHWYHAVHKSTGFSPYLHKKDFPERLKPLLAEYKTWYAKLNEHAIRAEAGE